MSDPIPNFDIVMPIYEGVDLMDVAGPYEFFSWWAGSAKQQNLTNVTITLAAETCAPVKSRDNFILTPNQTFDYYYENKLQANMIWTPGGNPDNLHFLMQPGTPYMNFLNQQAEHADWVCSVCEGALLLAAAGLLDGYEATTHWYFIPCLAEFKEITVAPNFPRFIRDRNRMTGGGISSGLDESLELIKIIAGEQMAENVQLNTQYYPKPPVSSTIPGSTECIVNMTGVNLG
jgi:transcriptional regulator GlxA family with amidase domain